MTGLELATLRRAHGWTQRQLAAKLGVTEITVRRYELGLRRISTTIELLLKTLTPAK
jgi:transcriptional regulator with XRE-family HTH domain